MWSTYGELFYKSDDLILRLDEYGYLEKENLKSRSAEREDTLNYNMLNGLRFVKVGDYAQLLKVVE